ncbi:hypothetical protein AWZ03_001768 [Drosophila navojoa]|uniref:Uncharacterized protein n=1 Tax=Drosophila navojoa TaxID=7232 RepID=A0A484BSF8_DRONA|nr:hypothetical protein AWZ03_001768 [Drosophila navojoa]
MQLCFKVVQSCSQLCQHPSLLFCSENVLHSSVNCYCNSRLRQALKCIHKFEIEKWDIISVFVAEMPLKGLRL